MTEFLQELINNPDEYHWEHNKDGKKASFTLGKPKSIHSIFELLEQDKGGGCFKITSFTTTNGVDYTSKRTKYKILSEEGALVFRLLMKLIGLIPNRKVSIDISHMNELDMIYNSEHLINKYFPKL